jgi:UDP-N-acetylmuramoyl-tripeptide--D-alanyl-D-alanine ligase
MLTGLPTETGMDLDTTWGEAARATNGLLLSGEPGAPLRSLATDTRALGPEDAFWALKGERFDAHDFLGRDPAASASGWVVKQGTRLPSKRAPRILAVEDTLKALGDLARHHRSRFDLPVVGITGTNGKTTVKQMLAAILAKRGPVCATQGNYNNEIGLPLTLFSLGKEHRAAVVEMGASRKGDIAYLADIARPTLGVLTNIGPAHLEFFGDEETVFRTKSELVGGLAGDAPVALFAEDPWLKKLLPELGSRAIEFGWESGRRVRALEVVPGDWDSPVLEIDGVPVKAARPMGRIHRINAAAAAAAAVALGVPTQTIEAGLADFQPAPLRFAQIEHACGARLVVDSYNANPASASAGVETFLELHPDGQRVVVLGDMLELGERSEELHRSLLDGLAGKPLAALFLAGERMVEAAEGIPEGALAFPVYHARDAAELAGPLRGLLTPTTAVYFKASRLMKLEALAESL